MFSTQQQQKTCQCHLKNHDISVQNTNKQLRGTDVSPPARTYGPSSWKLLRDHYCIHWICSSIPTKLFKREPHKGGIYSRAVIRKVFVSKAQTMHKLAYGAQNNGKNSHAYWVTVYRISCVRAGLSYEKANLRPQFAMSVASDGGSVTAWAQVWWKSLVYRSAASCRGDLRSQINTVKIQMNLCLFFEMKCLFVGWFVYVVIAVSRCVLSLCSPSVGWSPVPAVLIISGQLQLAQFSRNRGLVFSLWLSAPNILYTPITQREDFPCWHHRYESTYATFIMLKNTIYNLIMC